MTAKVTHPSPKPHSPRETANFADPMVPLRKGKWRRASECTKAELEQVVTFLEKNVADTREGVTDLNKKVLVGAKDQLSRK